MIRPAKGRTSATGRRSVHQRRATWSEKKPEARPADVATLTRRRGRKIASGYHLFPLLDQASETAVAPEAVPEEEFAARPGETILAVEDDDRLASLVARYLDSHGLVVTRAGDGASGLELARRVRAFNPWPGAFTTWQGGMLKIQRAHAIPGPYGAPGETTIFQSLPAFCTADGLLVLDELQPAGKKPQPGKAFLQGARGWGKENQ